MILEEEQKKYEKIHELLIDYRQELDFLLARAKKISDPFNAAVLTEMYERMIFLYEKNKQKPYFAKLHFQQNGIPEKTVAYIGRIGFANLNDEDIIVDWRAPISELYYNSKLGKAHFFVEKEKIEGVLELKRQINFEDGQIISVYDIDNSISSDEFLQPYLSGSSDNRLKNIIATIQQEQDEIIRLPLFENIVIQGVAGSGKTTVALHRLSYLIYNNRNSIKPEEYLIISPSVLFKTYISELLEELDADLVQSFSIEELIKNLIAQDIHILKKHEQHDFLIREKKSIRYLSEKTKKSFLDALNRYIQHLEEKWFKKDFYIGGIPILDSEEFFSLYGQSKMKNIKLSVEKWAEKVAFELIRNQSTVKKIDDYCKQNNIPYKTNLDIKKEIEKGCQKHVLKFFNGKLSCFELYKDFIKSLENYLEFDEIQTLKHETLQNLNKKILSYDDIGAFLYLYSKIFNCEDLKDIKQVLIDEAQDFSYTTFAALRQLMPNANFSIFGDTAQGIYDYQAIKAWNELETCFEDVRILNLNKSYRTTIEITTEANKTLTQLGLEAADNVIRSGEAVDFVAIGLEELLQLAKSLKAKYKNLAIICANDEEVEVLRHALKDDAIVFTEDLKSNNTSKIKLLTAETSKGLEFDAVILYNLNSYGLSPLELKKLYVAKTRALHKLVINKF